MGSRFQYSTIVSQATSSNTRNLIAACAAICVFGFAFGMTYPLLSLQLEARGVSTRLIGINAAMTAADRCR